MASLPGQVLSSIRNAVSEARPQSILVVVEEKSEVNDLLGLSIEQVQMFQLHIVDFADLEHLPHVDVAVMLQSVLDSRRELMQSAVARLRDVAATLTYVLIKTELNQVGDSSSLSKQDLFELGFTLHQDITAGVEYFSLFRFDIEHYKTTPNWLNANDWANPERWGKNRW